MLAGPAPRENGGFPARGAGCGCRGPGELTGEEAHYLPPLCSAAASRAQPASTTFIISARESCFAALAAVVASEACLAFVDARFAFAAAEAPARFARCLSAIASAAAVLRS